MTIHEPMTAFTDLLVALWTWGLSLRLLRSATCWAQRAWALSIAMVGLSALTGGLWHALSGAHPLADPLWTIAMAATGLSAGALAVGSARGALPRPAARLVTALVAPWVAAYLIALPAHAPVGYAVAHYGLALLLLLGLEGYAWLSRRSPSAPWFLAGIVAAIVASGVQAGGLTIDPSLNHNDLAHLLQLVVMGLFYRGAALLRERGEGPTPREARSEAEGSSA